MPFSVRSSASRAWVNASASALLASVAVLAGCSSDGGDGPGVSNGQAGQQSTAGGGSSVAGSSPGGDHAAAGTNTSAGASTTGGNSTSTSGSSATGGAGAGTGGMSAAGTNAGGMSAGGAAGGGGGAGGGASMAGAGGGGPAVKSDGCTKMPTLKNSTSNSNPTPITISVGGTNREYAIRWPSTYDNTHPYRLIFDLHGYGGTYKETAGEDYFGLWTPSKDTTIFVALSAISTDWRTGDNVAYVQAVLKAVEADLCIDTSRVMLEGFSQGAAQVWQLACSLPGVFRAAVGHSGGGVPNPSSCMPIPYLGSGGLQESVTQTTQTDQFAKWNGCMISTLTKSPTGGHACSDYMGCPATAPVRWCNYDGPHTPLPTDSGQKSSWMPTETWPFFSKF